MALHELAAKAVQKTITGFFFFFSGKKFEKKKEPLLYLVCSNSCRSLHFRLRGINQVYTRTIMNSLCGYVEGPARALGLLHVGTSVPYTAVDRLLFINLVDTDYHHSNNDDNNKKTTKFPPSMALFVCDISINMFHEGMQPMSPRNITPRPTCQCTPPRPPDLPLGSLKMCLHHTPCNLPNLQPTTAVYLAHSDFRFMAYVHCSRPDKVWFMLLALPDRSRTRSRYIVCGLLPGLDLVRHTSSSIVHNGKLASTVAFLDRDLPGVCCESFHRDKSGAHCLSRHSQ